MPTSALFRLHVSTENSFNQTTLLKVKLVIAAHNEPKQQVESVPYAPLFLAPICFMIVWAVVVFTVAALCKVADKKGGIATINRFEQVPCRNCRFFSNSHHLKCAVHPSTALTEQALDCSDYCP